MNIQIHHFLMQPVTPCNVPSVVMLCTESFLNGLPDNSILWIGVKMIEYVLIAVTIVQGAYLGQYDTKYEVVQQYHSKESCSKALKVVAKDEFKVYTCLKIDKD